MSQDHSLRLWNHRTQVCVIIMTGDGGHTNEVLSVVSSFSPPTPLSNSNPGSCVEKQSVAFMITEIQPASEKGGLEYGVNEENATCTLCLSHTGIFSHPQIFTFNWFHAGGARGRIFRDAAALPCAERRCLGLHNMRLCSFAGLPPIQR